VIEFLFEVLAFCAVLYILRRYVWSGGLNLRKAMAKQQQVIADEIEESHAAHEQLVNAEQEYRKALAEAKAESAQIQAEARDEGEQIVAELKARAHEEYRRLSAMNEGRLAAERQSVVSALRAEIGRLTLDLAELLVAESLRDNARQRRVVDRFLADLSADLSADRTGTDAAVGAPVERAGRAR